ncbi:MAG: murein biosynthesis integral membrane protein MurJ [Deltaproteobacteria bacterium]|nr:murein biosynthesis integral membrane protein MurJ [Deltaproteobacteria bacterium]
MAEEKRGTFLLRRFHMGWAALIMGFSVLLSRFMGLFRDKVISYLFGATLESDLYFAAFVIPDFLNYLLAGGYFSITLIPLLSTYFAESEHQGWRFFSATFTWIAIVMTPLTIAAMVFAPHLTPLAAPGLGASELQRLAFFLRIILPAQLFFLLGSALTALLFLRKQFTVPALTPLVYNFFIILGGVLMRKGGMEGFCWGVLAGAFAGNFLLPFITVWRGGFSYRPVLRHPALKRFVIIALPLMLGQSIVVLDEQLVRIFGSMAGTGAVSRLNYARRIMMVPVGVVAQAAGVASYPFLAELVSRRDYSSFHQTLNLALRGVLTLLIPLSVWMMCIARPVIILVFQQGHFQSLDTEMTVRLLQVFLTAVTFWGIQQVVGRGYYARQDTLSPALLGTAVTALSVPFFWVLTMTFEAVGVALASAVAIFLYAFFLAVFWWRRFGNEAFHGLRIASLKLLGISIAAGVLTWLTIRVEWIDAGTFPYCKSMYEITVGGMVFALVFLFLSTRFAQPLVEPFLRRMGSVGKIFMR